MTLTFFLLSNCQTPELKISFFTAQIIQNKVRLKNFNYYVIF